MDRPVVAAAPAAPGGPRRSRGPLRTLALASAIALALAAGARAQSADPTAPPPGLDAIAAGVEAPPAAPPGPELQSILVSREPGGRRIAVISGEMVRQGSRYQGALVELVGEDRVVLRRGKKRETLRLYGEPREAAAAPAAPARQE